MTTKSWIIQGGILFGVLVVLSCIGIPILDLILFAAVAFGHPLFFGWFLFLERVVPAIRFDGQGLLLALATTGLLTALLHVQIRKWRMSNSQSWRLSATAAAVVAGLGCCIAGICLVGMIHEMLWMARADEPVTRWVGGREAGRRTQSKNNLKQIGLALHNYHDFAASFPAGGTFGPGGKGRHGWMTYLLPHVDQRPLYDQIDLNRSWNDPGQRTIFETTIHAYQYPQRQPPTADGYATAAYAANPLVVGPERGLSIRNITDGTSNTIAAGDASGNFKPWGHPANWRDVRLGINKSPDGFGSPFKGGAHFLMADGTVRFASENIDPQILQGLATPAGGEPSGEF